MMSAPVDMVVVPGVDGDFGAMAKHTPVITTVRPGVVEVHDGGKVSERMFVTGGFAEVTEKRVTVLAEDTIPMNEISENAAKLRHKEGEEALVDAKTDRERAHAEHILAIAGAMHDVAARRR